MEIKLLSIMSVLLLTGCTGGMHASHNPGKSDLSSAGSVVLDGRVLYQNNCAACHGSGSNSAKLGRSASQISGAIATIPNMSSLGSLSALQISAIASYLTQNPTTSPVAAKPCVDSGKLLSPQVKRLTVTQFGNSLRAAFGNIFTDAQMPNLSDANPRLGLASDADHLSINEVNVQPLYDSAASIATTIVNSNATVRACVLGTDTTCFTNLAQTFGLTLWRRPLTSAESGTFTTEVGNLSSLSRQARMEFVLKALILSPKHWYRTEIGSSATPATAAFQLTQYEVASLLAFSVWDSPPDATLFEQARLGRLYDKVNLRAQLARMMQDARFQNKMAGFTGDVLKIEDVRTAPKDASYNVTTADRAALLASAYNTLRDSYSQPSADFMAPFKVTRFQTNNLTARYFNMSSTGMTSSFTEFNVNPAQRYGILSHPAFLTSISGQISSGIVRRGVYTLEQLLCNPLGSPPPGAQTQTMIPPGFDSSLYSSREVLRITHSSQAACIGCHSKIDPAGFGFENFGPFGQFRTVEKAANIPIDSSGDIPNVGDRPIAFSNSVGFLRTLAETPVMRSCLNRHFFKAITGESASTVSGACEIQNVEYGVAQGGNSIQALLESMINLESFTRRQPAR